MERPRFLRGLPGLVLVALAIALIVKTFLFQAFLIPSGSMIPTLRDGDRVIVNKVVLLFRDPRRGEVVVFDNPRYEGADRNPLMDLLGWLAEGFGFSSDPTRHYIKRVVGLPGERLEIRDGRVFIDGERLAEPYVAAARGFDDVAPIEIPRGEYFLMGDNRTGSEDSRVFGTIERDTIVGKALAVVWPPSRIGGL